MPGAARVQSLESLLQTCKFNNAANSRLIIINPNKKIVQALPRPPRQRGYVIWQKDRCAWWRDFRFKLDFMSRLAERDARSGAEGQRRQSHNDNFGAGVTTADYDAHEVKIGP